jgi:hypothetical protein
VIALLVITDGRRDCITRTIPSALAQLEGPITHRVIYDDSGDDGHRDWLEDTFPTFEIVSHPMGRQGFGGAIRAAWAHCRHLDEDYIFHLEDDFTFNRPVPLDRLAAVLRDHPYLVQLALRRQPWNDVERAAGGIVESRRDEYTEHADEHGNVWLEHRCFFTTNPSLYRTELTRKQVWPKGLHSEGMFSQMLARSPKVRFGYWGSFDSGEAVTHIGEHRVGTGY